MALQLLRAVVLDGDPNEQCAQDEKRAEGEEGEGHWVIGKSFNSASRASAFFLEDLNHDYVVARDDKADEGEGKGVVDDSVCLSKGGDS